MNQAVAAAPVGNPNNLELNVGDNFIFGVDVSASMQMRDCPGNMTRIDFLKEKVIQFATEASKFDTDGIDVLTFGHTVTPYPGINADRAQEIIGKLRAEQGATHTHDLIRQAFQMHKAGSYAQTVLFIATDGAPSDRDQVLDAIVQITEEIKDEHEFAISILTVGHIDPGLQAWLTQLDDDLPGAKHDIVDVKRLEDVDFMTAFVGALHD